MRRRYSTSDKKLPILIFVLIFSLADAKNAPANKDINIICYAAQSKWICSPENDKKQAQQKAIEINSTHSSTDSKSSEVIINKFSLPKFKTVEERKPLVNVKEANITEINNTKEYTQTAINYDNKWSHQLIVLSSLVKARQYIKQKKLDHGKVLLVKNKLKDTARWIILYGLYDSKVLGVVAQASLPSIISKPWLRSLSQLEVINNIEKF